MTSQTMLVASTVVIALVTVPIRNRLQRVVDRDLFASEFVIRAQRMGRDVREIPIALHEKRPPSTALLRRVPRVLKGLVKLGWTIRIRHR